MCLLQMYQPEGIYIVLVGIEVWTSGDLINVNSTDRSGTLRDFCQYRKDNINLLHHNDNSQLIT